ncbi:MAG: hypothetical protein EOM64_00500 [Erysipelotrichia bacterium]|nr:hypothetical protein [Erysipelotrichia bacterium]
MKKTVSILVSALMALSIVGCKSKDVYPNDKTADLGDDNLSETLDAIQKNSQSSADTEKTDQSITEVTDPSKLITQNISSSLDEAVPEFSNRQESDVQTAVRNSGLKLVTYSTDDYSITMPKGWTLVTCGQYASFGFNIFNPNNTAYQIFRYGALAPFLKNWDSKQLHQKYSPGFLTDAPVMTDRSAKGLLNIWNDCISYQKAYSDFIFPYLDDICVQNSATYKGLYTQCGGSESTVIATGTTGRKDVQCIMSTAVFDPGTSYNAGVDTGYLILYETVGVFAPADASAADIQAMLKCASSVEFSEDYVKESKKASGEALASVTAQLSENRVLMEALQMQWNEYING